MARIAIIGAGPAGSSAAIGLARAGVCAAGDIALVEAQAFPRVKVCGEFLSPAITGVVESLVGVRALAANGARRCERFVLELGAEERGWQMPTPAWALSRGSLDVLLRDTAAAAGVRLVQPARVARVEYDDDGACLHFAAGGTLDAEVVIHADGSGRHDLAGPVGHRKGVVGMKCHFRPGGTVEGVRIRSAAGAYIGTIQVEGGMGTCAMVVAAKLLAEFRGDADALLMHLWPEFVPGQREGRWLSCGVAASGYVAPGHAWSLRVGNAAGAVEPIGGEGIGLAVWAGVRVAGLLGEHGVSEAGLRAVQMQIARSYRRRLALRHPACRVAAWALMRPGLVRAAWPMLRFPGATIGPWYAMTGKRVQHGVSGGNPHPASRDRKGVGSSG